MTTKYGHAHEIDPDDSRQKRWEEQRAERGFDDTELWSLNHTLAQMIMPRLQAFKEKNFCYPCKLDNYEQWVEILEKMVFSFQMELDRDDLAYTDKWDDAKYKEGLQLFAEYFGDLWI